MSYNNDPSKQFRESMRLLGESYSHSTQRARKESPVKTYPIPRVIIGLMGLVFVWLGLFLMDGNFHLSVKFLAFALFGSGIIISLHLFAILAGFLIRLKHRRLNKYTPKGKDRNKKQHVIQNKNQKKRKWFQKKDDEDDPYSHI